MIDAITDLKELDKIWRTTIIYQTGLPDKNVLNATSIRGADLADFISKKISTSFSLKNVVAVFHINLDRLEDNISMVEEDGTLTSYASFKIDINFYGAASVDIAKMLKARLESEKCRNDLYNQGIFFKEVSELNEVHDFINETMWARVDMSIDFGLRLTFTQKDKYEDFDELNSLSITRH